MTWARELLFDFFGVPRHWRAVTSNDRAIELAARDLAPGADWGSVSQSGVVRFTRSQSVETILRVPAFRDWPRDAPETLLRAAYCIYRSFGEADAAAIAWCKFFRQCCSSSVESTFSALKNLSQMAKVVGWSGAHKVVDAATMLGYVSAKKRPPADDVEKWLLGERGSGFSKAQWRSALGKVVSFRRLTTYQPTFEDFVLGRHFWATDGSDRRSKLEVDGEPVLTRRAYALSAEDHEVWQRLDAARASPRLRVFVKPDEKGDKFRYLAVPDFHTFMAWAYALYFVERTLDSRCMTILMTSQQKYEQWLSWLRGTDVLDPLDATAYDHNVTTDAIDAVLDFVEDEVEPLYPAARGMVARMREAWGHAFVEHQGKLVGVWKHGVPSGLPWTSLLNSWVNAALQVLIVGRAEAASGDDAVIRVQSFEQLTRIPRLYEELAGQVVNPAKNFADVPWRRRTEYLKGYMAEGGVTGYPLRVLSSLLYRKPGAVVASEKLLSKLSERMSLWKTFFDRAGAWHRLHVAVGDLARVARWDARRVQRWLASPCSTGGFGLSSLPPQWIEWVEEVQVTTRFVKNCKYDVGVAASKFVTLSVEERPFHAPERFNAVALNGRFGRVVNTVRDQERWHRMRREDRLNELVEGESHFQRLRPKLGRKTFWEFVDAKLQLPNIVGLSSSAVSALAGRAGYTVASYIANGVRGYNRYLRQKLHVEFAVRQIAAEFPIRPFLIP